MIKKMFLFSIKVYQKTISLDQGFLSKFVPFKVCRYYPTCSEYTYQSIEKYGVLKGSYLGIKRIFRCNPWSKGGIDHVK